AARDCPRTGWAGTRSRCRMEGNVPASGGEAGASVERAGHAPRALAGYLCGLRHAASQVPSTQTDEGLVLPPLRTRPRRAGVGTPTCLLETLQRIVISSWIEDDSPWTETGIPPKNCIPLPVPHNGLAVERRCGRTL